MFLADSHACEDSEGCSFDGSTPVNTEGYTLREIDLRLGRSKGSAFRAFKRQREGAPGENVDFTLLPAHTARAEIERLRAAGRIYRSSINVIVLTESGFDRVRAEMEQD